MLFNLGMFAFFGESEMLIYRLFGNILNGVVLSNTQKVSVKDRKVVEVGLTRFLAKSDIMISDSHRQLW
jgi:exportin-2 (importin alpha re-exporter)